MKKLLVAIVFLLCACSMTFAADLASDATYKAKCAMCHGPNGEGKPNLKTTPLKNAAGKSDAELTQAITKGMPPKMPAFAGKLTDDQVKELVSDIKALK
jgi:cytochrome c6